MQLILTLGIIFATFFIGLLLGSLLGAKEKELKYDIKEVLKEGK